jgi:hypothetical protein
MHRFFILFILTFCSLSISAQEIIPINHACNYHGADKKGRVYAYESDHDAEHALEKIMEYTGLPANFELKATNVPNAAAALQGYKRYIFYNQSFMQRISQNTQSDWTAYSILAHEIGHHLSGHTLSDDNDRHIVELEADRFSGYILYQMGATQEEALLALNELADDEETPTHPSKYDRKIAVIAGWNKAKRHFSKTPDFNQKVAVNKNYSLVEEARKKSNDEAKELYEENSGLSYSSPFKVDKVFSNVTESGHVGMKVKVKIRDEDLSQGDYKCVAWYYDKAGERLNDKNGKYNSSNNQVSAGSDLYVNGNGLSSECDIFIPYSELHQGEGFNVAQLKLGLFRKKPDGAYDRVFVDNNFTSFEYFNIHKDVLCEVQYSRIELNKTKAGVKGVEVLAKVNMQNMDDDEFMIVSWFYDGNGNPLIDVNKKFSSNGTVVTYESFRYDGKDNMAFNLFIPYDEFHLPSGNHDLQYRLGIFRKTSGKLELVKKEKVLNSFLLFN